MGNDQAVGNYVALCMTTAHAIHFFLRQIKTLCCLVVLLSAKAGNPIAYRRDDRTRGLPTIGNQFVYLVEVVTERIVVACPGESERYMNVEEGQRSGRRNIFKRIVRNFAGFALRERMTVKR